MIEWKNKMKPNQTSCCEKCLSRFYPAENPKEFMDSCLDPDCICHSRPDQKKSVKELADELINGQFAKTFKDLGDSPAASKKDEGEIKLCPCIDSHEEGKDCSCLKCHHRPAATEGEIKELSTDLDLIDSVILQEEGGEIKVSTNYIYRMLQRLRSIEEENPDLLATADIPETKGYLEEELKRIKSPHPAPKGDWIELKESMRGILKFPDEQTADNWAKFTSQLLAEREKEAWERGHQDGYAHWSKGMDDGKVQATLSAYKVVEECWDSEKIKERSKRVDCPNCYIKGYNDRQKDLQSFLKDKTK